MNNISNIGFILVPFSRANAVTLALTHLRIMVTVSTWIQKSVTSLRSRKMFKEWIRSIVSALWAWIGLQPYGSCTLVRVTSEWENLDKTN